MLRFASLGSGSKGNALLAEARDETRATRLLGNLLVSRDADGLAATSKFILVALRRGHSETFSGTYRHRLIERGDSFAIRNKTVLLIQNDEPQINLTFLP